ncbi:hypothetical protein CYMTET_36411, partial [Cymbomonas tetramitiformis]
MQEWETVPSMLTKRQECAAVVQGQHVYAIGGYGGSGALETVERLDTATDQWEAVASMRTKRGGCAAVVQGQHVYAIGGYGGSDSLDTVERLDTATDQWEAVASMRTKRFGCAALMQGQYVYVLGGHGGSGLLETVERLNTATWETVPSMHNKRFGFAAHRGQHVYAIGGYDGSRNLETVERLDTATGQWEAVASMCTKRNRCAAVVQGQHVYVLGGSSDLSPRNGQLDTVERSRLITAGEDVGGSTPSVVSLAELDELYHQLRSLRLSAAPRQRLPADAAHLLEQLQRREEQAPLLEGASLPLDSALLEGGTLRAMQDTWRAAQRAVRDVAAGECNLQQECPSAALQEAARERDVVRQEYTCALQAALQQWATQLPEDTIAERTTWLQEQVDSWRGVMGPMGEASGGHASSGAAAP